jgi:hypothetical protein
MTIIRELKPFRSPQLVVVLDLSEAHRLSQIRFSFIVLCNANGQLDTGMAGE